jgi:uncharacterized membrane protein YkvI
LHGQENSIFGGDFGCFFYLVCGIHAGGGFASGAQTMSFLTRYGKWALWTPFVTVALMAVMFRELIIMAKNHNTWDFRSLSVELYKPYDKIMAPIYEICILVACVVAVSSCVAGGATVLRNYLSVSYGLGIVLIGLVMLVLAIFGAKLVARANTVLSVIIIVAVFIICVVALTNGKAHLGEYLASDHASATPIGFALLKAISYTGFQAYSFGGLLGVSYVLKTTKNISKMLLIGFIINGIMLWLTGLVMLSYMPDSLPENGATLPLYYVCQTSGLGYVLVAYIFCLLAAYISTGTGVIFGMVKRYSRLVLAKKPEASEPVVNFIIGAIFIAFTVGAATFGLTRIINYGFGYMGYVGMVSVFLPTVIVGHIKNKKFAAEHPKYDEENLNREDAA